MHSSIFFLFYYPVSLHSKARHCSRVGTSPSATYLGRLRHHRAVGPIHDGLAAISRQASCVLRAELVRLRAEEHRVARRIEHRIRLIILRRRGCHNIPARHTHACGRSHEECTSQEIIGSNPTRSGHEPAGISAELKAQKIEP